MSEVTNSIDTFCGGLSAVNLLRWQLLRGSHFVHTWSAAQSYTGWRLTYPSEKYESQLGWLSPIYGKIKNVPNHQSAYISENDFQIFPVCKDIHKGCMLNSTICEVKKENATKTSPSPSVLFLLITSYHPHQHRPSSSCRVLASIAPVISSIGSRSCNCVLWEWRKLLGKENWNVCCLFVHEIVCCWQQVTLKVPLFSSGTVSKWPEARSWRT